MNFSIKIIGKVQRKDSNVNLHIEKEYRPALNKLDLFSHILVVWWGCDFDTIENRKIYQTELPYAPGVTAGIFTTRSPVRPNPLLITLCKILNLDEESGIITINNIDAYDNSPILDLKPYVPVCDLVKNPIVADWARNFGDEYPETGLEVEDYR